MADRWFYTHDEKRCGPFSGRQMRGLADSGAILPTDIVWKDGVERGVAATQVTNLFAPVTVLPVALTGEAPVVEAPPAGTAAPGEPSAAALVPVPSAEPGVAPRLPKPPHVRRRIATAVMGATIVSQDGTRVRYKKRCTTCQKEDSSTATATLRPGSMREWFFCPNCRKRRVVELRTREQ